MLRRYLLAAALLIWFGATPVSAADTEPQKALVTTLQQIITQHLGIDGCTLAEVDSETSFVVQIFCPAADMPRLLGQSGMFLRSLKILFNDLYLDLQQRQLGSGFVWEKAKKMHLRFVEKD